MKPEDPGPIKDKKVKEELKAQYTAIIDDGMQDMDKALEIDKEYEDAMAYMNLLIREQAVLLDNPDSTRSRSRRPTAGCRRPSTPRRRRRRASPPTTVSWRSSK